MCENFLECSIKKILFLNRHPRQVFREVTCPRTLALPVERDSPDSAATSANASTAAKRRKKLLNHLNPRLPTSVSPDPENCELYGLCSVVVHSGASSECGHYYCFSRHSQVGDVESVIDGLDRAMAPGNGAGGVTPVVTDAACGENQQRRPPAEEDSTEVDFLQDKWCLFNDSRVSHATYASFSNVTRRFQKDTPYVLVYRKLSLDSHDAQPPSSSSTAANAEPPLSQELRDAVNKDNTQYLKVRKTLGEGGGGGPGVPEFNQVIGVGLGQVVVFVFRYIVVVASSFVFTLCKTNSEYCRGTEAHEHYS